MRHHRSLFRAFQEWLFSNLIERMDHMAGELADLQAKVAANTTVIESAITLIQGLKAALDAAGTDPAALKALSDALGAEDQKLADAVAANTPAPPPVTPPAA